MRQAKRQVVTTPSGKVGPDGKRDWAALELTVPEVTGGRLSIFVSASTMRALLRMNAEGTAGDEEQAAAGRAVEVLETWARGRSSRAARLAVAAG
jgi:hypothetical protein